jgi:hypothetical protein
MVFVHITAGPSSESIRRRIAVAGTEYRYCSDDHSIGRGCIFISSRSVQIFALAIQIAGWIWYFAALQTSLSGWSRKSKNAEVRLKKNGANGMSDIEGSEPDLH